MLKQLSAKGRRIADTATDSTYFYEALTSVVLVLDLPFTRLVVAVDRVETAACRWFCACFLRRRK